MDSPRLSVDDNKKINILILIIISIVILIFGLLLIYSNGVKYNSNFLNKIISGLTAIFLIFTFITSILYVVYRYNFGDNILDNIDIIIKPIMYTALSGIVAMILLFSKNTISSSKVDFDINMIMINVSNSRPSSLTETPAMYNAPRNNNRGVLLDSPQRGNLSLPQRDTFKGLTSGTETLTSSSQRNTLTSSNKYITSTNQVDIMTQSLSPTSSFNI
jgi:hypothetical protein